jgi:hypothetical protein
MELRHQKLKEKEIIRCSGVVISVGECSLIFLLRRRLK